MFIMMTVPTIIEQTNAGPIAFDIYSRLMMERIIFLHDEITDESAQQIIAQLLYLEKVDPEKDITLYINSPGGVVSAGLAIYDTMQYINCDVVTVCMGLSASMGAILLSSGTKGKRYALPNAEIMIHQPSGGVAGQCSDIMIVNENILKCKKRLNTILANNTGQNYEKIERDTDRDCYLTAEEAIAYGLIDGIISKRQF